MGMEWGGWSQWRCERWCLGVNLEMKVGQSLREPPFEQTGQKDGNLTLGSGLETGGSRTKPMTSDRNQEIPRGKIPISVEHNWGAYHRTSVASPIGRKGAVSVLSNLDEEELASS